MTFGVPTLESLRRSDSTQVSDYGAECQLFGVPTLESLMACDSTQVSDYGDKGLGSRGGITQSELHVAGSLSRNYMWRDHSVAIFP